MIDALVGLGMVMGFLWWLLKYEVGIGYPIKWPIAPPPPALMEETQIKAVFFLDESSLTIFMLGLYCKSICKPLYKSCDIDVQDKAS